MGPPALCGVVEVEGGRIDGVRHGGRVSGGKGRRHLYIYTELQVDHTKKTRQTTSTADHTMPNQT
jgi:hypothetical protein